MRRSIAIGIVAAALVATVPGSAPAPPPCWPNPSCPAGSHEYRNVLVAGNAFTPHDIPDVHYGYDWLSFFNLDHAVHTVTDARCLEPGTTLPCAFDLTLHPVAAKPQQYTQGWNTIVVGAPNPFRVGETYAYRCRVHEGMTGSFTVVR